MKLKGDNAEFDGSSDSEEPQSQFQSLNNHEGGETVRKPYATGGTDGPFEFVALEACLESACSLLDNEVKIF